MAVMLAQHEGTPSHGNQDYCNGDSYIAHISPEYRFSKIMISITNHVDDESSLFKASTQSTGNEKLAGLRGVLKPCLTYREAETQAPEQRDDSGLSGEVTCLLLLGPIT